MSNPFTKSFGKFGKTAPGVRTQNFAQFSKSSDQPTLSEQELAMLTAFPDAVSLHGPDGKSHWASPLAGQLFCLTENQNSGLSFLKCINPQDRVALLKTLNDCANGSCAAEVLIRTMAIGACGQGSSRVLECRARHYCRPSSDENEPLIMLVTRDVSDDVNQLTEARDRVDSAESASHLKSHFISNVSHELRTPLNAIIGFSEMLEGKSDLKFSDQARVEYAGLINQSANHLLNVLNDILDISKIEAGKFEISPEVFAPEEAVKDTLKLLKPIAMKAGIELVSSFAEDLPNISADKRALRQITINLVANAIKFSRPRDKVKVHLSRSARRLRLEVIDEGIGMESTTLDKLGSMFFQAQQSADREYEGTGLGLSIVKGLIELHHGAIRFESELGKGTCVIVDLPVQQNNSKPVPADPDTSLVFLNNANAESQHRRAETYNKMDQTG